jgi:3-hydroxyacyl-CoA dehydrogenase
MMIAIYGAGSIGTAWAIVFGHAGHDVSVYDPDVTRLNTAGQEIESRLEQLAELDLIESPAADIIARIAFVSSPQRVLSAADYVQECVPENLELKQEIFRDLERMCRPEAVLASSSSALTATKFAEDLPSRSRCLVVHPGNPPYLIRVVEVVPAPFTDQAVVERTGKLLRQAGMAPIILRRELEGFVFNRLQGALLREAYCLVRDGVISANELDDLVRHGLGFRWSAIGPFETAELNTRGGIEAHAKKMGPSYARMGAERGQNDPWTDELVSKVKEERRKRMPLAEWDKRVEWRDRVLMQLLRHRHQIGLKINAPL